MKKKFAEIEKKIKFHEREIKKEKEKLRRKLRSLLPGGIVLYDWFDNFFWPHFDDYILKNKPIPILSARIGRTIRDNIFAEYYHTAWINEKEKVKLLKELKEAWKDYFYVRVTTKHWAFPRLEPDHFVFVVSPRRKY